MIRINKLPHRFSGQKWPKINGYVNINVTSSANGCWRELSPMLLGPIIYTGEGVNITVKRFENLWQFSKVWPSDIDKETGLPNKEWYFRRYEGWKSDKGVRYVKKGSKPIYSFWAGQKLSYIEARRIIYCPIYEALARRTNAFKKLKSMFDAGYKIQILGYDGYDVKVPDDLHKCFLDESRPFGHELVLACMLVDVYPWK